MSMDTVVGHEIVRKLLADTAASGTVSHAYIFEGKSGVGRKTAAKAFAALVSGCGGKYDADSNPDIAVADNARFGDTKKKTPGLSIDAVRALKKDVYTRPYMSDRKVYIIPDSERMAPPAQNSLLKIFEEPPPYCTIIMITDNANSLLQTIRSRAIIVRFQPLERAQVESYLVEKAGVSAERAAVLAAISGGSIGRALELSEDDEAIAQRDTVIGCLMNCMKTEKRPLYDFIKFLKQSKPQIKEILEVLSTWFEDVLHIKCGGAVEVNADKVEELRRFGRAVTREAAFRLCEIVTKYTLAIGRNANYSIAVQCMAFEFWEEIHGRSYRSAF